MNEHHHPFLRTPGRLGALLLVMSAGVSNAATSVAPNAATAEDGVRLSVWFDALFDETGLVRELRPQDASEQPEAFWTKLKSRLQDARIQPMQVEGKPATFRTGMRVSLEVRKAENGSGGVAIRGMAMAPLVASRYFPGYPKDVGRHAGWFGEVTVSCTVSAAGQCINASTKVEAPPGMPDSVRRWAKVTLESWTFRPQEINGQPIESTVTVPMHLRTRDDMPKEFREPRKL